MNRIKFVALLLSLPVSGFGRTICPPEYLCSTNATVLEVKNVRTTEEPGGRFSRSKTVTVTRCDLVLKTQSGQKLVLRGDMNCGKNSLQQKVTVYIKKNEALSINWKDDPDLEPPFSEYPMPPFTINLP